MVAEQVGVDLDHLAREPGVDAVRQREVDGAPVREQRGGRLDALAHERIGAVGPRDADAQVGERVELGGSKPGAIASIIRSQPATSRAIGPAVS